MASAQRRCAHCAHAAQTTPLRPWAGGAHFCKQAVRACSSEQRPSVLKVEQTCDVQPQSNEESLQSLLSRGNGKHPSTPPKTPKQKWNQEPQQALHEPQLITSFIVRARSVDELQRVVEANKHDLNRIHAAAALVKLAKLCSTPPAQNCTGSIREAGDVSRSKVTSPASSQGQHFPQRARYDSTSSTPASAWPGQDAWGPELPGVESVGGQSNRPASVHSPHAEALQQVQALAGSLEQHFANSTQRLSTIRQHANVCWALGKLGHAPSLQLKRSLRRRLASYTEPVQAPPDSRIGQEVANLAHGLAQLGLVDPSVWVAVCKVVEVQAHHCRPMELAHLGWALARTVEATQEQQQQQQQMQHAPAVASSMDGYSSKSSIPPQVAAGYAEDRNLSPELTRASPWHTPTAQLLAHHPPPVPDVQTPQTAHRQHPPLPLPTSQQHLRRPQLPNHHLQQPQQQQQQVSQGLLHLQHPADQLHSQPQPIPSQVLHPPNPGPSLSSSAHPTPDHQPQHTGQPGSPADAQHTSQRAQHAYWFPPPPHRPSRRPLQQKPIARPLPTASPQQEQPQVSPLLPLQPPSPSYHSVRTPLQQDLSTQQQQRQHQQVHPPARPVLPATQAALQPPHPHVRTPTTTSAAWSFQFKDLRGSLRAALGCVAEVACSQLAQFQPGELITLLTACAKGPCPPRAQAPIFVRSLPLLVKHAQAGRLSTHDIGNSAWAYARARQVAPGQKLLHALQGCLLGQSVPLGQPEGASSTSNTSSSSSGGGGGSRGNQRELPLGQPKIAVSNSGSSDTSSSSSGSGGSGSRGNQRELPLGQPEGAISNSGSSDNSSSNGSISSNGSSSSCGEGGSGSRGNRRELSNGKHSIGGEASPSEPLLPPLSAFSHQELCNVLWACAVLYDPRGTGANPSATGRGGSSVELRGAHMQNNPCANVEAGSSKHDVSGNASSAAAAAAAAAAGVAAATAPSSALVRALAGELGSRSAQLGAAPLASSAWSLATLGYADFGLYAQLLQAAGPKASQFNTQELANLLWALSSAWEVCGSHAAWACLQRSPSSAQLMHMACIRAPSMEPIPLAQLAWFAGWLADTEDVLPPPESVPPQPQLQHRGWQQPQHHQQQQQQQQQQQRQQQQQLQDRTKDTQDALRPPEPVPPQPQLQHRGRQQQPHQQQQERLEDQPEHQQQQQEQERKRQLVQQQQRNLGPIWQQQPQEQGQEAGTSQQQQQQQQQGAGSPLQQLQLLQQQQQQYKQQQQLQLLQEQQQQYMQQQQLQLLQQQQQQYKQQQWQLVESLSRSACAQMPAFKPADLVVFAAGMSRAQRHAPDALLFDALAGAAVPMLRAGQLNPQAMASLAASFARTRQRHFGFACALAAAATAAGLQRFTPVQIANLLWALTSMRVRDRALVARAAAVLLQGPLASLRSHSASAAVAPAADPWSTPVPAPASGAPSTSSPAQHHPPTTSASSPPSPQPSPPLTSASSPAQSPSPISSTSSPAQSPSPSTSTSPPSPQGPNGHANGMSSSSSCATPAFGGSDPGRSDTGAAPAAVGMTVGRKEEEAFEPPPDASQTSNQAAGPHRANACVASEASVGRTEEGAGWHAYAGWRDGGWAQGWAGNGLAASSSDSGSRGAVGGDRGSSVAGSGSSATSGRICSSRDTNSSSSGQLWAEASAPARALGPTPSPIHTHNLSHISPDATSTSSSGQKHVYGLEMSAPHMTWTVLAWVFARSNYHQHRLYDRLALAVLLGLDEYGKPSNSSNSSNSSSSSSSSSSGNAPFQPAVSLAPEPPSLQASSTRPVCAPDSAQPQLPAAAPGTAALRALSNQCLVQLLWAHAVHDHRYEALLQAAAPLLAARVAVGGMTPPQVACIAWAYARLQHHAPILFRAILKHALAEADRFDLRCWSRLAWAFSTLCLPGNALFPRLQQLQQEKDALCHRRSLARSSLPVGNAGHLRRQSSGRDSEAVMEDSGVPILPSREI